MRMRGNPVALAILVVALAMVSSPVNAKRYIVVRDGTTGKMRVIDPDKKSVWYNVTHPVKFIKKQFASEKKSSFGGPVTQKDMEEPAETVTDKVTDSVSKTTNKVTKTADNVLDKVPGASTVSSVVNQISATKKSSSKQ